MLIMVMGKNKLWGETSIFVVKLITSDMGYSQAKYLKRVSYFFSNNT